MKQSITKSIFIAFLAMLCGHLTAQETYTITTSTNPPELGCNHIGPCGTKVYDEGIPMLIMAHPGTQYLFINWTEDGEEITDQIIYYFTVERDRNFVANFVPIGAISIYSVPIMGGFVTGEGIYEFGTEIVVTATPAPYYEFSHWLEEDAIVSDDPVYPFVVTGDRHLAAIFEITTTPFEVTVSANPPEGGIVTGGGFYTLNTSVTVTAESHPDFLFLNWTENGTVVSTAADYSFSMYGPRNLVANFVPATCEITLSKNMEGVGVLHGAGIYSYGQMAIVYATEYLPEYMFTNWTENGNVVSWGPIISAFPVTQSRHLVANFTPATYEIPVYANPSEGGVVTGGGTYTYGASVTISATPNPDYQFLNWTRFVSGNGTVVSTDPIYTYELVGEGWGNCAFVAYFAEGAKVTVLVNIPGGEILGGGVYHYGDEVTVEAIPHFGYQFVNWTEGAKGVLSTDNPYTFTVTEDRVLTANFEEEMLSVEPIDAGAMMIYPNPTTGELRITNYELQIEAIDIYDISGKKLLTFESLPASETTLNISHLAQGAYILKVYMDQGEVVTWRVVKN